MCASRSAASSLCTCWSPSWPWRLSSHAIAAESDYALAAGARPFFGQAGSTLIAVATVVSTSSAINATLYGAAKFTYLMGLAGFLVIFAAVSLAAVHPHPSGAT